MAPNHGPQEDRSKNVTTHDGVHEVIERVARSDTTWVVCRTSNAWVYMAARRIGNLFSLSCGVCHASTGGPLEMIPVGLMFLCDAI